jgi:type I restriction enzyme M protein
MGGRSVDRLTRLVGIFEGLGGNGAGGDDLLGDAYEYLMRHFATESGKSKGQFYTPAEVSRTMALVLEMGKASNAGQSIYDPTCGSGSLLLKAHDEAKHRTGLDLAIYGQEMDNATSALARMNMVLHDCPTAEIWQANTLANPHFTNKDGGLRTFDFVLANPPFSNKAWTSGLNPAEDPYERFEYGIPPAKNGDYAFLLHILKSLKSTGRAAVILPHGVLFRGGAEAAIRTRLVKQGLLKGIIGLPANLFYGTGIPACIIVMDKAGAAGRKGIFMIDASKGFIKDGNKNRLRAQDIHRIVDTFVRQQEVPKYASMVPLAEIEGNDFNLNLPRYIDSQQPEDLQDIEGHLRGGIPVADVDALQPYWAVCPRLRQALFRAERCGYLALAIDKAAIKPTIYEHPEFAAFIAGMNGHFAAWRERSAATLRELHTGSHPKQVIAALSEGLLEHYAGQPLIDPYDVYQHLMDYWAATMQDDVYLIAADGWKAETYRVVEKDKKGKEKDKGWACDLVPKELIVARYFAAEQAALNVLAAELDSAAARMAELEEEHGGEDGLFAALDKVNKASVAARLREIKGMFAKPDDDTREEAAALEEWLSLSNQEADLKTRLKSAEAALGAKVYARYPKLGEAEIKTLVVDDKWLAALDAAIHGEMDRISQALTRRVKDLAERYEAPLPAMSCRVTELEAKVNRHLEKMGFAWN